MSTIQSSIQSAVSDLYTALADARSSAHDLARPERYETNMIAVESARAALVSSLRLTASIVQRARPRDEDAARTVFSLLSLANLVPVMGLSEVGLLEGADCIASVDAYAAPAIEVAA